jgi:hypothetical protein
VPGIKLRGFLGGLERFILPAEVAEDLAFAPPGAGIAGRPAFEGFAQHLVEGDQAFGAVQATAGGNLVLLLEDEALEVLGREFRGAKRAVYVAWPR